MQEGSRPIFGFPLLSDERENVGRSLAEAAPGQRVFGDERVWKFLDGWEPGEELGSVTIEEIPTPHPGRVLFRAVFRFDQGGGPIVVTGFVPGEGTWVGSTRADAHGQNQHREIDVEGRNPKRWG
jgi:hypothetical protein